MTTTCWSDELTFFHTDTTTQKEPQGKYHIIKLLSHASKIPLNQRKIETISFVAITSRTEQPSRKYKSNQRTDINEKDHRRIREINKRAYI